MGRGSIRYDSNGNVIQRKPRISRGRNYGRKARERRDREEQQETNRLLQEQRDKRNREREAKKEAERQNQRISANAESSLFRKATTFLGLGYSPNEDDIYSSTKSFLGKRRK